MKRLIAILTVFSILFSCNNSGNKKSDTKSNLLYTRQIDGVSYYYYGSGNKADSVIAKDINGNNVYFELYQNNQIQYKKTYSSKGNRIDTEYFSIEGVFDAQKNIKSSQLVISYDANGLIKEKGVQGNYNGIGVPIGTWWKYHNGSIVQEIYYHNDEFGSDYIIFKTYDENGSYKEEITNNYILYENEIIHLSEQEYLTRKKLTDKQLKL